MAHRFSFSLEGCCPDCGKTFDKPGTIIANGHEVYVNDGGVLAEDDTTDLILT